LLVQGFGDAKIEDLHKKRILVLPNEKDVVWFEITVDDACTVSHLHRVTQLPHDMSADIKRWQPLAIPNQRVEWIPLQILHHIKMAQVGYFTKIVVDTNNMRVLMGETRRQLDLTTKTQLHSCNAEDLGLEDFDYPFGGLVQRDMVRQVDHREATPPNQLAKAIFSSQ